MSHQLETTEYGTKLRKSVTKVYHFSAKASVRIHWYFIIFDNISWVQFSFSLSRFQLISAPVVYNTKILKKKERQLNQIGQKISPKVQLVYKQFPFVSGLGANGSANKISIHFIISLSLKMCRTFGTKKKEISYNRSTKKNNQKLFLTVERISRLCFVLVVHYVSPTEKLTSNSLQQTIPFTSK